MKYDIDVELLCKEYLEGVSVPTLAQKHNCNPEIIYNRLKKSNNDLVLDCMRKRTQYNSLINEESIIRDYTNSELTIEEIAKKYKCSKERIKNMLSIKNKDIFKKMYEEAQGWDENCKKVMYGFWELDFGENRSKEWVDKLNVIYRVYGIPEEQIHSMN